MFREPTRFVGAPTAATIADDGAAWCSRSDGRGRVPALEAPPLQTEDTATVLVRCGRVWWCTVAVCARYGASLLTVARCTVSYGTRIVRCVRAARGAGAVWLVSWWVCPTLRGLVVGGGV